MVKSSAWSKRNAGVTALTSAALALYFALQIGCGKEAEILPTHAPLPDVQLPVAPPSSGVDGFAVSDGQFPQGKQLWENLGCIACHAPAGLSDLATRCDFPGLADFLTNPPVLSNPSTPTKPSAGAEFFPHDFEWDGRESEQLAAWLLRKQKTLGPASPGWFWQCFEVDIKEEGRPDLQNLAPTASNFCAEVGLEVRTRDNHFYLRFETTVEIPESGEWAFILGSDDSSWLTIDGEELIQNEGLAPYRQVEETIYLHAGPHELVVEMTQGAGEKKLTLEWMGPNMTEGEPIPVEVCGFRRQILRSPPVPETQSSTAPNSLTDSPSTPATRSAPYTPNLVYDRMTRDGCYACHSREGQGGISQLSRPFFKGTEDLGFEGSLPPDLSAVGARLQSSWLVSHLTFAERARPYVLARCVVLDQASAENWAQLFADADPVNLPATPTPTTASVKRGQQLAGNTGFQCITCHTLGKYPSPSIQGMDLGLQTRRMHFGTFQKWLQHPTMLRPGTRMPTFWAEANEAAEVDQTALWNWIALGDERPLPAGLVVEEGSFDLIPTTRPLLHGCSLSDLSARCMAVGGPGGAHYAYDLAHLRLAWLWRGDFLDAEGTWRGRILDELEPESEDWIVLPEEFPFTLMQEDHRNPTPKLLGWRLDEDGWPTMRIQLGGAEILDTMRSDWTLEGTRFIREIRVLHAAVQVDLGQIEGLTISPSAFVLQAGETQKVNYSW